MKARQDPILCDRCRLVAMANMEGMPLCAACLIEAFRAVGEKNTVSAITPLTIGRDGGDAAVKGLVKPPDGGCQPYRRTVKSGSDS